MRKSETIRDKREYERSALGGKFRVLKYYDNLDILMYVANSIIKAKSLRIIIPNESIIKSHIKNTLRKQIQDTNSKEKLRCFITIKYRMCNDFGKNISLISEGLRNQIRDDDIIYRITNGDTITLNSSSMISHVQQQIISQLYKDIESAKDGSGFVLYSVDDLQVETARSKATVGGLYIELPDFIKNKKACVNIQNDDKKCFLWCLLASTHYNGDVKGG